MMRKQAAEKQIGSAEEEAKRIIRAAESKGEAAKITDRNGFSAWWSKYPTLQQNQEFLAIAQELGKKFPKK